MFLYYWHKVFIKLRILRGFLCKSFNFGNHCRMDALFSRNVEDKEVFFKKNDNVEGVVENVCEVKNGTNDGDSILAESKSEIKE